MKAQQIVEYGVILAGLIGAFLTLLSGWQKHLDAKKAIAEIEAGKSKIFIEFASRLASVEQKLEKVEENEGRYLNLLEKLANRYSSDNNATK